MNNTNSLSNIALDVIKTRLGMLRGRSLTGVLSNISAKNRAAVQALLYVLIRHQGIIRTILPQYVQRRPNDQTFALLELGIALLWSQTYQPYVVVNELVRAAKKNPLTRKSVGFINAIFRSIMRDREKIQRQLTTSERALFNAPRWWIEKVKALYPDSYHSIFEITQQHPPLTLRVNVREISVEQYKHLLQKNQIQEFEQVGPEAIALHRPVPVHQIPGFNNGLVSVQDAGTQLAAHLLPIQSGDHVLDACAAPGGKTAHLLELYDCHVTALEISPSRAKRIEETLQRLRLKADIKVIDANQTHKWHTGELFDAILLDAPCTASGITRRQPDVPWVRKPEDIYSLAQQQKKLLYSLWPLVKPGGHLLYVTCSIFPEEGYKQIRSFMQQCDDAMLCNLPEQTTGMLQLTPSAQKWDGNLYPSTHDGFFFALLQKKQ